ncbi:hypothetical protein CYY_000855 [Polysphondylium violaceum]|uniref:FNIP repeat-containing protein n=1 Tax=Polysphondylium violaceum TaxID=133409 RepID=A0A8J4Q203_9MYCE|nr:hypothetical protein CYY_000855 [Polysphondylium violaceum]
MISYDTNLLRPFTIFRDDDIIYLSVYQKQLFSFKYENLPQNIHGLKIHVDETFSEEEDCASIKERVVLVLSKLPTHISHLHFVTHISNIEYYPFTTHNIIPSSVTHLGIIGIKFPQDTVVPPHVTHLRVGGLLDNHSDTHIPSTVTTLTIEKNQSSSFTPSRHCPLVKNLVFKKLDENYLSQTMYQLLSSFMFPQNVHYQASWASEQHLPVFSNVYRVYDQNFVSPIPQKTKHLIWNSLRPVPPNYLPSELTKLVFGPTFNSAINSSCIPQSVKYLKFKGLQRPLSSVSLPPNLESLALGKKFTTFIDGHKELPKSLTHLEIYVSEDPFHWLQSKGNLPKSITNLKLKISYSRKEEGQPLIIPSSVSFLDIHPHHRSKVILMDKEEYYKESFVSLGQSMGKSCVKHIEISTDLAMKNGPLPSSLTSLVLTKPCSSPEDSPFNNSIIPPLVSKLKCPTIYFVPIKSNHYTYLEYSIYPSIVKIVLNSPDKPINTIPTRFNFTTSTFTPPITDRITELHIKSEEVLSTNPPPLAYTIGKLYLEINSIPPGYISSSVEHLHILSPKVKPFANQDLLQFFQHQKEIPIDKISPKIFQPTLKKLTLELSRNNLPLLLNPPCKPNQSPKIINFSSIENKDLFFIIYRNVFLKTIISDYKYPTKFAPKDVGQVIDAQKKYHNITLCFNQLFRMSKEIFPTDCRNIEGVELNYFYNEMDLSLIIPRSVTRLSLRYRGQQIPPWITHLQISGFSSSEFPTVPPSVTHLSLWGYSKLKKGMIPPTVTHLSLDSSTIDRDALPPSVTSIYGCGDRFYIQESSIPTTVRMIRLEKIESLYEKEIPEFILNKLDGVYQIYHPKKPISKSTDTLIWNIDSSIPEGLVPTNVKRILFGKYYNQTILPNTIPSSVLEIKFGPNFNQSIDSIWFPESLKYLTLENTQITSNFTLPESVCHLKLRNTIAFEHCFDSLPVTVSHLICSSSSVLSIPTLPTRTMMMVIKMKKKSPSQSNYHQAIEPNLQVSLVPANDAPFFNQFIKPDTLISNITCIEFDHSFNQIIMPNTFPPTIIDLCFGASFNQNLHLPCLLKRLVIKNSYFNQTFPPLPESLQELHLSSVPSNFLSNDFRLPSNIKMVSLDFENYFCETLPIPVDFFPRGVQEIRFTCPLVIPFERHHLPPLLKRLTCNYFESLFDWLPSSVEQLSFVFNHHLSSPPIKAGLVPLSVSSLTVDTRLSIQDLHQLPSSIKNLKLGLYVKGKIPNTVESLEFDSLINIPLDYLFN